MSHASTVPGRIEAVRKGTIDILERLTEKAQVFMLPEPPAALEDYRRRLVANNYQVLVVGEAKRGKSSFVNALIGREILPTDVDVATCQVFRIRRAAYEAYRIRFEDESEQEITAEDLPRYGSQVVADVGGMPSLKEIVRWIEVDLPAHFLPDGVSILDTPGLGSLYSAHAQITQRFVPLADAVIFILDSSQPIIQVELQFIDTILGITPNIFFIQTKIDQQRKEHWQTLLRRNQEILQEQFRGRLTDARVWPISSANLMKAVQTGDDDYLGVSRYRQLAAVLQVFLFRVAGWGRSAKAIQAAENYYVVARKTLAGRLAALTEESEQKRAEVQQRITERKRRFDSEWGQYGQKQEELIESVRKVARAGKQTFLQALQQGSEIEMTQRARIDSLLSLEEAKQYNEMMDGQVVGAVLDKWRQVRQQSQSQYNGLLAQFLAIANSLSFPDETDATSVVVRHAQGLKIKDNWASIMERANSGRSVVEAVVGIFLPSTIASVAALCWAGVRAWFIRDSSRLEAAKQELHKHLDDVLQAIRQQFLGVDLTFGYQNRVDAYFDYLVRGMAEQVQKIAAQKSAETQAELDRMSEEAKLDEQQRKVKVERTQEQLAQWDAISQSIKEVVVDLKILDQSLEMFSGSDA